MVLHLLINHGMNDTKFVSVQQALTTFNCKYTKINEAIWFNKIRQIHHVTRKYIHAEVSNTFYILYRVADKSLVRPGRKRLTGHLQTQKILAYLGFQCLIAHPILRIWPRRTTTCSLD
jgi:hypothetical protein